MSVPSNFPKNVSKLSLQHLFFEQIDPTMQRLTITSGTTIDVTTGFIQINT
jgi:hypothetical protein